MNRVEKILIGYCLLIAGIALVNLVADPSDQPMKDISAVIFLGLTAFATFTKNRNLQLAFPAFLLITTGMTFANTNSLAGAIGGMAGAAIPFFIWLGAYRQSAQKSEPPQGVDKAG